jgi:hypothetical protein
MFFQYNRTRNLRKVCWMRGAGRWSLVAGISASMCLRMEGRGFSPGAKLGRELGALAPEGVWLQGLKAHWTFRPEAVGLKPRPSRGREENRLLMQLYTRCWGRDLRLGIRPED